MKKIPTLEIPEQTIGRLSSQGRDIESSMTSLPLRGTKPLMTGIRQPNQAQTSLNVDKVSENAFKKTRLNLKNILRKQKVNGLVSNFRLKIKRNIASDLPVEFNPYKEAVT